MKTTNKLLLAGSTAIGLALAAAPAMAQLVSGVEPVQCSPDGGTTLNDCAGTLDNGADDITTTGTVSGGTVTGTQVTATNVDISGSLQVTGFIETGDASPLNITDAEGISLAGATADIALSGGDITGATNISASGDISASTFTGDLTGDVTSTGTSSFNDVVVTGGISTGVPGATPVLVDDGLDVNYDLNVDGTTTTNGISNTGNVSTTTLTSGTSSTGATTATTLTSSGNTTLGTGAATVNSFGTGLGADNTIGEATGTNTINGDTTFNGNTTFNGTVTGIVFAGDLDMGGNDIDDVDDVEANSITGNATSGTGALLLQDSGSNSTLNLTATEATLQNDTSYVQVNPDSVVIHGGTTSTTVVVDDSGFTVMDDDGINPPVTTFAVSNTGDAALLGTLTAGGVVSSGNVVVGDGIAASAGQNAIATGVTIDATTQRITGVANGVISATSNDAVTGQQLFATNQSIVGLQNGLDAVNTRVDLLDERADKAYQGVAMGFALNAAPLNLANGEGGLAGGVGYFQGEWAGGVKAQYVTDAGVGVGVNVGFSEDAVGGGLGASIKF